MAAGAASFSDKERVVSSSGGSAPDGAANAPLRSAARAEAAPSRSLDDPEGRDPGASLSPREFVGHRRTAEVPRAVSPGASSAPGDPAEADWGERVGEELAWSALGSSHAVSNVTVGSSRGFSSDETRHGSDSGSTGSAVGHGPSSWDRGSVGSRSVSSADPLALEPKYRTWGGWELARPSSLAAGVEKRSAVGGHPYGDAAVAARVEQPPPDTSDARAKAAFQWSHHLTLVPPAAVSDGSSNAFDVKFRTMAALPSAPREVHDGERGGGALGGGDGSGRAVNAPLSRLSLGSSQLGLSSQFSAHEAAARLVGPAVQTSSASTATSSGIAAAVEEPDDSNLLGLSPAVLVGGLMPSPTEEELLALFSAHGAMRELTTAYIGSGHALACYFDARDAVKAVLAMRGMPYGPARTPLVAQVALPPESADMTKWRDGSIIAFPVQAGLGSAEVGAVFSPLGKLRNVSPLNLTDVPVALSGLDVSQCFTIEFYDSAAADRAVESMHGRSGLNVLHRGPSARTLLALRQQHAALASAAHMPPGTEGEARVAVRAAVISALAVPAAASVPVPAVAITRSVPSGGAVPTLPVPYAAPMVPHSAGPGAIGIGVGGGLHMMPPAHVMAPPPPPVGPITRVSAPMGAAGSHGGLHVDPRAMPPGVAPRRSMPFESAPPVASGRMDGTPTAQGGPRSTPTAGGRRQVPLDMERVASGEDTRTSLMIRNIPNKYTQSMLLEELNEALPKGSYDFVYLPIDFKNACNVGYAFVNMTSTRHILTLHDAFAGKRWRRFLSDKVCVLSYARIQGKANLVQRFQHSSLLGMAKECRPLLFVSSGPLAGQPEQFPMPEAVDSGGAGGSDAKRSGSPATAEFGGGGGGGRSSGGRGKGSRQRRSRRGSGPDTRGGRYRS